MTHLLKKIPLFLGCLLIGIATCKAAPVVAPVAAAFDIQTVAASNVKLPPYPYVDYPSTLPEDYRRPSASKYDKAFVIAGSSLFAIEGNVSSRYFMNSRAGLSAFSAQRNYANLIKALGGVKVNTVSPADPQWLAKQGAKPDAVLEQLGFGDFNLHGLSSYDVYLIRSAQANVWIVVAEFLENQGTNLLVVEEKAMAQTVSLITSGSGSAKAPVFPYVDYPSTLSQDYRRHAEPTFDETFVIAGASVRAVEGNISTRYFDNSRAGLSEMSARRSYADAVKLMGGVKVNTVTPADSQWLAKQGGDSDVLFKKLGFGSFNLHALSSYDVYLLHRGTSNTWIVVSELLENQGTNVMVVDEKAMEQTVGAVTADKLATTLKAQGHVALYLSFDTGLATIRSESAPVVDEVVKLLRAQPNLRLSVEGHTDNVGNKAQNRALSLARAKSVMAAIAAQKIAPARLSAAGFGADKPIADNGSEDGRAKNRRVELVQVAESGRNQ